MASVDSNPQNQSKSLTLTQHLEAAAKRPITISTALTTSTLSKCHAQLQSPIFGLPAEIRELIFSFATAPYYAPGSHFSEQDLTYRPDHEGKWITSVGLLETCRRVWLETNHLPMQQAHHCFYLPDPTWEWTDPKGSTAHLDCFVSKLTPNNRQLLRSVHVFADRQYMLTHGKYVLPSLLGSTGACPEVLTITARHVDGRRWDSPHRLSQDMSPNRWLRPLLSYQASPRLQEIHLELETIISKETTTGRDNAIGRSWADNLLDLVVATCRADLTRIERVDELGTAVGVELLPEAEAPPDRTWFGPANLDGKRLAHFEGLERIEYRIVTLVWKVRSVVEGGRVAGLEEVPGFAFSDADLEPQGKPGPENAAARKEVDAKWERDGSLLRFVE